MTRSVHQYDWLCLSSSISDEHDGEQREQERLGIKTFLYSCSRFINASDLQHALFGITLSGKLHLAPINPNPQHVLDIATGRVKN